MLLDQVILASDEVGMDAAGPDALRQWLEQGGRLWIPLERVSQATVARLLGDGMCYEEVGRVGLSAFTIEDVSRGDDPERFDACDFERPVLLIRVLTDATDVVCRVDGWPSGIRPGMVKYCSRPSPPPAGVPSRRSPEGSDRHAMHRLQRYWMGFGGMLRVRPS